MTDARSEELALKEEIYETRRELIERIDELDFRVRRGLSPDRIAAQHPRELSAAAAVVGLLVGLKAPRGLLITGALVAGGVLVQRFRNEPEYARLRDYVEAKMDYVERKANSLRHSEEPPLVPSPVETSPRAETTSIATPEGRPAITPR